MATFTLSHQDLEIQGPLVDVDIWLPQQLRDALSSKGLPIPPPFRVQGLIDTGASSCCITPEVIKALGAIPVGEDPITTASHAAVTAERYALAIRFVAEPTIFLSPVSMHVMPLNVPYLQCLIGRNVLKKGIFIYLGDANTFSISM